MQKPTKVEPTASPAINPQIRELSASIAASLPTNEAGVERFNIAES